MVAALVHDWNLTAEHHLLTGLRSCNSGDFLYMIGWKEMLHLSTIVTFPPFVSKGNRLVQVQTAAPCLPVGAHQSLFSLEMLYINAPLLKLSSSGRAAW